MTLKHAVEVAHVVPFHDCDMMKIVWHGNYYRYFELARSAFQQSLHMDWPDLVDVGVAMPIVRSSADYRVSLAYGDRIRITARCDDLLAPALDLSYEIRDESGIRLHARGVTRQVYVQHSTQEMLFALPEPLEARIRAAHGACPGVTFPTRGPA